MRLQTLIILVLLCAAGFSSPTHQTSETASNMMMLQPSTALATTDSDPISIINNLGFRDLGLPGAGTKDDPYRIEGLNFQLNASASYTAIQIHYTDAYFAIRDAPSLDILNIMKDGQMSEVAGLAYGTHPTA